MILLGYGDFQTYEQMLNRLAEQQTHFVMWGGEANAGSSVSISCDNIQGGFDITHHLLQLSKKTCLYRLCIKLKS